MKLSRRQLRKMILEEKARLVEQNNDERVSELSEYSSSKSGQRLMQEGGRIKKSGVNINELAYEQTGHMRRGLIEIGQFVENLGSALENINSVSEGSSTDRFPTIGEFKRMIKEIKRLEK
jgi:hypothetical protein